MRLIDTSTLQLHFFAGDVPPYAILSHTWGDHEVTFQDMERGRNFASRIPGFAKIEDCCRQAKRDGYAWAWIDTCCIDKQSSAELSEAINSMYRWYQHSALCYVYMADVVADADSVSVPTSLNSLVSGETLREGKHLRRLGSTFMASRWFKRGWTLQELIAPRLVEFYDKDWVEIGTKASLVSDLQRITGIRAEVLQGVSPGSICTIAERMSWASKRETQRVEDRAYSLLGIFNVNMPLLYGEGQNAFIRLQEEILRRSEDLSLLAWHLPRLPNSYSSVLGPDPSGFTPVLFTANAPLTQRDSGGGGPQQGLAWKDVQRVTPDVIVDPKARYHLGVPLRYGDDPVPPPTVTSRGILVTLPVVEPSELGITSHPNDLLAWTFLGARSGVSPDEGVWLCIILRVISGDGRPGGRHLHGEDYLVVSRPAPGMARGVICILPRDIKHFDWKRLYLSYGSTPTLPRTEWSTNYPADSYPDRRPLGFLSSSAESLTSNVLVVRLGGASRISVDAHRPSEWKMTEITNGTHYMYIPIPDPHSRSLDESKQTSTQEAQFRCSYYPGNLPARKSVQEKFLVVFSTYYQGLSRRFSCRVQTISGSIGARETSPFAVSQREGLLTPIDRACLVLDSGALLEVALKETVHLIRDNCQFVGVTLTMAVKPHGTRKSPSPY